MQRLRQKISSFALCRALTESPLVLRGARRVTTRFTPFVLALSAELRLPSGIVL